MGSTGTDPATAATLSGTLSMKSQLPIAPHAVAVHGGEPAHYYMNFLALFGASRSQVEIERMAQAAHNRRQVAISEFAAHLERLRVDFHAQAAESGHRAMKLPAPCLSGWSAVRSVLDAYGQEGVLLALFHYGRHREICCDLAVQGIPFVAPVAKQAYFEISRLDPVAPEPFERAKRLIEVEHPGVGRHLLAALREGRTGLIYVDGNMGPDGHRLDQGGIEVDFLGKRIRVKEGIARLAQSLRRVVIPLVVRTSLDAPDHVVAGEPLVAPRDTEGRQRMMQSIYNALAAEVEKDPVPWEFAFCLHRWMVADAAPGFPLEHGLDEDAPIALLPQHVTLFERDRHQYWVHVGSQMAYRLPDWAYGLHGRLREGPKTARALSHEYSAMGIDASDLGRLLESLVQRRLLAVAGP